MINTFEDGNVFLPNAKILVLESKDKPNAKPTTPKVRLYNGQSTDFVWWGNDNNFPRRVVEQAYKIPLIPTILMNHANLNAGSHIRPVIRRYDDTGKELLINIKDQEIAEFIYSRQFKRYRIEGSLDLYWFQNLYPETILTKNRKKIAYISPNESMYCRWSAQNDAGICESVLVNANWPLYSVGDKYTTTIKAINPYDYDAVETVRNDSVTYKYIYPCSYPSPGSTFYQIAFWDSIRQSRYLDFLQEIPITKAALIKNKLKPAYMLHVPSNHWTSHYGEEWTKADHTKKQTMKNTYLENLNSMITDPDSAGGVIAVEFGYDKGTGKTAEKWELIPVPDIFQNGTFIEDNIEAVNQLFFALNMDPAMVGFSSKGMGNASGGSDKRESMLIYLARMQPFRDVILEPLRFVAEYNGWNAKYPGLDFVQEHTILTTLDTGYGQKKTPAP